MTDKHRPSARYLLAALAAAALLSATSCELLLDVLVISGGGGGLVDPVTVYNPINTSYAKTVSGGFAKDISIFNGKNVYALISFIPADKRESNSGFVTNDVNEQDWKITSSENSLFAKVAPRLVADFTVIAKTPGVTAGQSSVDLLMRESENVLLANKAGNSSRNLEVNYSTVPASITLNTVWAGIKIVTSSPVASVSATCKKISTYAYFFIDDRDIDTMAGYLNDYALAFDAIYEMNHQKFGIENDVDENDRVIIVFSRELESDPDPNKRLLGYFNPADKFSAVTNSNSNEGDIFYLTTESIAQGDRIKATLAHEFQHMIYFDEHYNRGSSSSYSWLNEALSQAAEYYNGYFSNHEAWIQSFLAGGWSGLSLTHWTADNYGYGAIFIRYLIDQFGPDVIKNMCATNKVGVAAVEAATGKDFNTIYYDFTLAMVLSGTGTSPDVRYNFSTLNLQALQPTIRKGLRNDSLLFNAGESGTAWNYPYEIYFMKGAGEFGTVTLTGIDIIGTAFGIAE